MLADRGLSHHAAARPRDATNTLYSVVPVKAVRKLDITAPARPAAAEPILLCKAATMTVGTAFPPERLPEPKYSSVGRVQLSYERFEVEDYAFRQTG
jgi:hypothetical protein